MGTASFQFLGFAAVVVAVFNLHHSVAWRQAILLLASLIFLGFFSLSPASYLPLLAFLAFGFVSVRLMQGGYGRSAFLPLLIAGIVGFIWLKKYSFVPGPFLLRFPYVTLGLSYIFFRVLHLIIDAKDGTIPGKVSLVSYLNYTLNFTTLISGPIQRYQDFASMQLAQKALPLNVFVVGQSIERIIVGFFKVNVLSLLLSMAQNEALTSLNADSSFGDKVFHGIVIAASYPFYLYCNFSGYIDIVIGIARLLRLELPENFNRPFSSDNFLNFWSRWHITLSEWLKTYVYNPLLIFLMRRYPEPSVSPFLGVFAFFVTFFLVGVWHGQTSVFIFFGVLQGLGVSATKLYQVLMAKWVGKKRYKALANNALYNVFARGLTFTWFAFTLLWFWSNWTQLGSIANRLGVPAILAAWACIFFGASLLLAMWEAARNWLLSFEWQSEPLLLSRYTRTVWGTALVVIATATVMLLNAPAPDIVYKAF
jgi:D-alanyl-lipoteichoic acid acyltransferase DltB (MBOAT superfamily)